jgi:GNAT superfamily N-acetyltransferase
MVAVERSDGGNLIAQRDQVRLLMNPRAPADGIYAYYALYHDPKRTRLEVLEGSGSRPVGFVAVCQTGQRLFTPTVVLRSTDPSAAVVLLRTGLAPGRPYYVVTTPDLREAVLEAVSIERPERNHVYILDLARFREPINVLVVAEQGLGGNPRFVIRSQGEVAAEAAISWLSPYFAEISVHTQPAARGRGWGRSVVAACARWVTQSGRRALYVVEHRNEASVALAKATGFVDTGVREFAGEGVRIE